MSGLTKAKQLKDNTFTSTTIQSKFATGAFDTAAVNSAFAAASIALSKLEEAVIQADGGQAFTGDQSMGSNKLTNLSDGTVTTDAVNLGQLNAIAAGLDPKESVRVATTQPLLNDSTTPAYAPTGGASSRGQLTFATGPTAIDGVTLANDDRVLVKDEQDGTAEVHSVDTVDDVAGSLGGTFFVFYATPNHGFYVWYDVDNGSSDPAPSAPAGVTFTGIEVDISSGDGDDVVATNTKTAIDGTDFTGKGGSPTVVIAGAGSNEMTITNAEGGDVTNVADGSAATGFTFATDTPGTGLGGAANGIWVRTGANTWDRAADFDTDAEVTAGAFMPTEEGTVNGDQMFLLTTNNPITIGGAAGTPLVFGTFGSLNLGGTPTTIEPDDAASEGVSTQAARSDHTHAIAAAVAGTIEPDDAAAEGSSTSFARADHQHAIAAGTPSNVGTANAEGSSTSFARADHVHDAPALTTGNKTENPSATSGDADDSGLDIAATPALDGHVQIFVNGVGPYDLADGDGERTTAECYFSVDAGVTARAISAIAAGDSLFWNGVVAGFDLETDDEVDMVYEAF